jgi:light-harvesting complex 1 beta chain
MTSFFIFLVIAIVAHVLVWQWRPWLPAVGGYTAVVDQAQFAVDHVRSLLS